jgi:uncharacterized protein (TIGR02996 family)
MSDGPALWRSILADPADDTARLVYADWLDEQSPAWVKCYECGGSGEIQTSGPPSPTWRECKKCDADGQVADPSPAALAEFIRLQIAIAKRPAYSPPAELEEIATSGRMYAPMAMRQIGEAAESYADESAAMVEVQNILVSSFEFRWSAPCGDIGWQANSTWVPECDPQFRRGLLSSFDTSVPHFMQYAGEIFGKYPVESFGLPIKPMHIGGMWAWLYDPRSHPPEMGIPPEVFRRLPGVLPAAVEWVCSSEAVAVEQALIAFRGYAKDKAAEWRAANPDFHLT